jgi:hypothetical protein
MDMTITSPAFLYGGMIPINYTADGENESPLLHILAEAQWFGRYRRR